MVLAAQFRMFKTCGCLLFVIVSACIAVARADGCLRACVPYMLAGLGIDRPANDAGALTGGRPAACEPSNRTLRRHLRQCQFFAPCNNQLAGIGNDRIWRDQARSLA